MAANQIEDVFIAGIYFTVFPNLLVSTFPRYLSALHLTPLSPTRTRVQAYRFWTADVPEDRRAADLAASQEVAAQDLDICEQVQRGYTAGVDTNGRLSVVHEAGVHHVHQLVRAAVALTAPSPPVVVRPRTESARRPRGLTGSSGAPGARPEWPLAGYNSEGHVKR